ncbi:hypothetical protein C0993_009242, partial [Termitomyces sp. T159_Od127]
MRDSSIDSYTTTLTVGAPIIGPGLVLVLRSDKEGIQPGDYMYGQTPWEAYTVQPYVEGRVVFDPKEWAPHTFDMDSLALQVVPNPNGLYPLSKYITLLGTPGLTGFVGFNGLVEAEQVIASVGSEAKVGYVRSLGADIVFNYKKESYQSVLQQHGPIHIFW